MSLDSYFQFYMEGRFKIPIEGGVLVFPTDTEVADTPLPDISTLPTDVQRVILSYLRTPSAECIAREFFIKSSKFDQEIYENLDGWLVLRRSSALCRRTDRYYQKYYSFHAREYAGHLCHRHWEEARERVSKYKYEDNFSHGSRVTPTQHSAWLREQLAANGIFPAPRTRRRILWTLFMAL
jgi:hypothetical protein